jgi:hypothetical protein
VAGMLDGVTFGGRENLLLRFRAVDEPTAHAPMHVCRRARTSSCDRRRRGPARERSIRAPAPHVAPPQEIAIMETKLFRSMTEYKQNGASGLAHGGAGPMR